MAAYSAIAAVPSTLSQAQPPPYDFITTALRAPRSKTRRSPRYQKKENRFSLAPPLAESMPPLVEGQVFLSLQDFKNALRDWAIERNWTPHILDSDSHRVRAGCRSAPDCPFRIRANYSVKRGDAKVTTCDANHTCEPFRASAEGKAHQDIKRAETGKLKFLLGAVPKLMTVTLDTNILEIIDAVERKYGQKIPTRQAQKVKAGLTDRVKGPCRHCHQLGHTRKHCQQLRGSAPGPLSFANLQQEVSHFADEDGDEGTYADGGLELDQGDETTALDPIDYVGAHQTDGHNALFTNGHAQQVSGPIDFGTIHQNGVPVDPILARRIQRLNSRDVPVPEQPAIVQNPQTIVPPDPARNQQPAQTPQEATLEAAKLMQQAARLLQEAARLNSEAARLTASAANL